MTMEIPSSSITLELRPSEIAGVIECLHDGILRRLRWSTIEHPGFASWRSQDIAIVQLVLDSMLAAYSKAVMTFREVREKAVGEATEFEVEFSFPDEVWDLLTAITTADSWNEVPTHEVHGAKENCTVCGAINGIA